MKPIIGITADSKIISDSSYPEPYKIDLAPRNIAKAVTMAGGVPVLIPIADDLENKDRYLDIIDGLILSGGHDVAPQLYGEEARPVLKATKPKRDASELHLAKEALARNKAILGLCRGFQLLNVAFGGTLYQDLSEYDDLAVKHIQDTNSNQVVHGVKVNQDTRMGQKLDTEFMVNSFHHQAVNVLGEGLQAVAKSSDNIIEIFESTDHNHSVVGTQFHPETLYYKDDNAMIFFNDLIERAKKSAN